ncbi:DUF429 domain-containing protein [Ectothiorhodospiraceae bacterium 2226]|nr:DUF429 domain-containing protein [Ectothiorhodospiraceae bacterium 2226]
MAWLAGVDGCPRGWVAVLRDTDSGALHVRVVAALQELLEVPEAPRVIAVDAPIGLLEAAEPGGRACDRGARALLGRPRASSVFSPPVRGALVAVDDYRRACDINRASASCRLGISRQCHAIFPKLAELDALITPALQARVREVHPELSFFALNGGQPVVERKKGRVGRARRLALLETAWGRELGALMRDVRGSGAARDDIVDAMAACWSAERIWRGAAQCVPTAPPLDTRGLRMAIWF